MNPAHAQHTPGPWVVLPNTPHFVRAMHPTEGMQPVATVYHFDGELEANARLIASAPELLSALQELCADKYLADPINADRMRNARAAIAKATGQPAS